MEKSGVQAQNGNFISQEDAQDLLEAAKESVILLREQKAAYGAGFQGDHQLEMLVAAILKAESR
jgi:hypothetical protein